MIAAQRLLPLVDNSHQLDDPCVLGFKSGDQLAHGVVLNKRDSARLPVDLTLHLAGADHLLKPVLNFDVRCNFGLLGNLVKSELDIDI